MRYRPFCPEHGIRIHDDTFVYYNGPSHQDRITATRRNLPLHGEYYVNNVLGRPGKTESHRLCYESSEDAVTFSVFTALLSDRYAIRELARHITNGAVGPDLELYLWGGRVDLENGTFEHPYRPLDEVRKHLELGVRGVTTEPDIMLVVPGETLVCIEAKFGSGNPSTKEGKDVPDERPKSVGGLIEKYCHRNSIVNCREIFDLDHLPQALPEQLFRNVVFAASMAAYAGIPAWYVVNLRSQHVMNLTRGQSQSQPVVRNMRRILQGPYKKRFSHWTWEDIFATAVSGNLGLHNLAWYMKNKTLHCRRAFNIL
jgi:hypothetical protein